MTAQSTPLAVATTNGDLHELSCDCLRGRRTGGANASGSDGFDDAFDIVRPASDKEDLPFDVIAAKAKASLESLFVVLACAE
uniref:Uncharacterized protein n=1 Tax=Pristionchus pacificus TaxID=54126 RepID=A0A2A6CC21_PRIPA|eukprot:PDM75724.1 hypothetical protein PRIPAC_40103 [Pristionchus pacificus]